MEIVDGTLKSITRQDVIDNKVTIPEGVTKIDSYVFQGFPAIYEVIIPESVEEIENGAFCECYDLEKVILPPKVKEIKESTFDGCMNLREVILPENVEKIGITAFRKCGLRKIALPSKVKEIDEHAFSSCARLEEVILEEGITTIKEGAFYQCYDLKKINLPTTLENLASTVFYLCISLEEINIPDGIQVISDFTFYDTSLKKIKIPDSVQMISTHAFSKSDIEEIELPPQLSYIDNNAFNSVNSLTKINTIWGSYSINQSAFQMGKKKDVGIIYAYLYANHLLKEKYTSIDDMLENNCICKLLKVDEYQYRKQLEIFKNLFYRLRKSYDVPVAVALSIGDKKDFSLKIWNEVKDAFPNKYSETMQTSLARMIETFGIFEKDQTQGKRVQAFLSLFDLENYTLNNEQYHRILSSDIDQRKEIEKYFEKCKIEEYCIKSGNHHYYDNYKKEFSTYLSGTSISLEQYKKIKKLSGTYGKKINDFIKENYELKAVEVYRVKREYVDNQDIKNYLFNTNVYAKINYDSIHRMFDGSSLEYNESFYNFFMDNIPFIMENETYQSYLSIIAKKFSSIQKYYLQYAGVMLPSLAQVIDYLENQLLLYQDGNYGFMKKAQEAGIKDQETFDFYQKIYNKNKTRKLSSLVKRSNIYEINGYTIQTELLRKDDPLTMLVGESNYTNCCQVYDGAGQNCMAHATSSDDGGIFVTRLLKDGEWILLTQSWDWQNNNLYCHDNIEGTEYLKQGPDDLKKAVAEAFRLDAEAIIEKSKMEIEAYIKERKKRIEKSLLYNKGEELNKLNELEKSQVIKAVTSGIGYDDLGVSKFFHQSFSANREQFIHGQKFTLENFQPLNYNSNAPYFDSSHSAYSDASEKQYVMAGSLEDLVLFHKKKLEPIYRDERRVSLETGVDIEEETADKVKSIEKSVYPKAMLNHQSKKQEDYEDENIYIGEDWYLIYEEKSDNSIYISDLARINPDLEDEKGTQMQEMMNIIYGLVKRYDKVEADLKEDTSYLLYLLNKKLGYIEQIGEDISYPYNEEDDIKTLSLEEQDIILKNARNIRKEKNPGLIMHKVTFKKGKKMINEEEQASIKRH